MDEQEKISSLTIKTAKLCSITHLVLCFILAVDWLRPIPNSVINVIVIQHLPVLCILVAECWQFLIPKS